MTISSVGLRKPANIVPSLATLGFSADLAAITWPLAAMDHDIALPHLSSCLAFQIGAKLAGSIHWLCLVVHTLQNRQETLLFQAF
jgi:hypothetical protein